MYFKIINKVVAVIFIGMLLFGFVLDSSGDVMLNEFEIAIQYTDSDKIKLECDRGCAWKSLSFQCPEKQCTFYTNNFGISETDKSTENDFIIKTQLDDDKVNLTCKNGCAWKSLNIGGVTPNSILGVNAYGVKKTK
jgi:hypothetical protein